MHTRHVLISICFALAAILHAGCSVDPEQRLVGKWKGDSSAMGTAIKAAKMKADNPGVEGSTAMAAARALGATTLDLNADKPCALVMGGNTLKGKWAYIKEESLVELNLESAEIPPENQEKNPDGFKPQTYVVVVDPSGDSVEVLPMDRDAYNLLKEAIKDKKRQKFMVLRK